MFTKNFLLTIFLLSFFSISSTQAAPCDIDLSGLATIDPASGSTLVVGDQITLPDLSFEADPSAPNPGIVWVVYDALPSGTDPSQDSGNFADLILVDTNGDVIYGGGTADIGQSNIFNNPDFFVNGEFQIFIVPVIIPDIVNAGNSIPTECTGIVVGEDYPSFFLQSSCPEGFEQFYFCETAYGLDLANIADVDGEIFSNYCFRSSDLDPNLDANEVDCFGFTDYFGSTFYFSFTGDGLSYDITAFSEQFADSTTILDSPEIIVYSGACGALSYAGCATDDDNDNSTLLNGFKTEEGTNYIMIIDGSGISKGDFALSFTEFIPCEPELPELTIEPETICFGTAITTTLTSTVDAAYSSAFIVLDGNGDVVDVLTESTSLENFDPGDYSFYTTAFAAESANDLIGIAQENFINFVNACESENFCCVVNALPINQTVLASDDPACQAPCEAISPTVTVITETVCLGEAVDIDIQNNAGGDVQNFVIIIDDADVGIYEEGDFPTSFPEGNYSVYGVGIAADEVDAFTATLTTDGFDAFASACDDGESCCSLSGSAQTFAVLSLDDPACITEEPCEAVSPTVTVITETVCLGETVDIDVQNNSGGDVQNFMIVIDDADVGIYEEGDFPTSFPEGNYSVYGVGIAADEVDAFTATLTTDGFDAFASACDDGESCCSLSGSAQTFTVLASDHPDCVITIPCEAASGAVVAQSETSLCIGETFEFVLDGSQNADFSSFFIITNGEELNLEGYSTTGMIDVLPVGTYTIHAFNIDPTDEASFFDELFEAMAETAADALAVIDALGICADLDLTGLSFTVLPEEDCIVLDPLTTDATITFLEGQMYQVTIVISGGDGDYSVEGNPVDGNTFVSDPIECGQDYFFRINDGSGMQTDEGGIEFCAVLCETTAGSIENDTETAYICHGGSVSARAAGTVLDNDNVLQYWLHDGDRDEVGNILDFNDSGRFSGLGLTPNQNYFVVAVAGPIGDSGLVDANAACADVSLGRGVIFLKPVKFIYDVVCDRELGIFRVNFSVIGGLGEIDNSTDYDIFGDHYKGKVSFGQTLSTADIPAGQGFDFIAEDNLGCMGTLDVDIVTCKQANPIEWAGFTGEVLNEGNLLTWITATETNNHYFELMRSTNGFDFEIIQTIDAVGNSTIAQTYNFLDKDLLAGTNYYQLRQVDYDGQSSLSEVILLERGERDFGFISLSPIPTSDFISVRYYMDIDGAVDITIYDVLGKAIMTRQIEATTGSNEMTLQLDNFSSGVYLMSIESGNRKAVERIIVE